MHVREAALPLEKGPRGPPQEMLRPLTSMGMLFLRGLGQRMSVPFK